MDYRISSGSCAAALLAAVAAVQAGAAPDSGALIARLARQPPAHIAFAEVRFSSLLAAPLVVSGTLEYADAATLNRHVTNPYVEHTSISGQSVRVEREGETPRTFARRRAPELEAFVAAMIGLLEGDAARLASDFRLSTTGDDDDWRLDLVPLDGKLRDRIAAVSVLGKGANAHCYVTRDDRGGADVILLGAAAERPLPQPLELAVLLGHCTAE